MFDTILLANNESNFQLQKYMASISYDDSWGANRGLKCSFFLKIHHYLGKAFASIHFETLSTDASHMYIFKSDGTEKRAMKSIPRR